MKHKNINFGEGNKRCNGDEKFGYLLWNLPAVKTCPFGTELCKRKCFAKRAERYPSARDSRELNYQASLEEDFVNNVIEAIELYLDKKKNLNKTTILRIHTSGDYYNQEYLDKWVEISNYFKGDSRVLFQSFTKSVRYLKKHNLGDVNIHFVYSVWNDTKESDIELAKELKLPVYWAKPKEEIQEFIDRGVYICPKTLDGSCRECYKKSYDLIISEYQ